MFRMIGQYASPEAESGIGDDVGFAQRHQIEVNIVGNVFFMLDIYGILGRYVLLSPFDVVGKQEELCFRMKCRDSADGLLIVFGAAQAKIP